MNSAQLVVQVKVVKNVLGVYVEAISRDRKDARLLSLPRLMFYLLYNPELLMFYLSWNKDKFLCFLCTFLSLKSASRLAGFWNVSDYYESGVLESFLETCR